MLAAVGYQVLVPGGALKKHLSGICDMIKRTHYSSRPQASVQDFRECDLYVGIKHWYFRPIINATPRLKSKVLWFDINGGNPDRQLPAGHEYKRFPPEPNTPYVGSYKCYVGMGNQYSRYVPFASRGLFEKPRRDIDGKSMCLVHNVGNWGHGRLVPDLTNQVDFFGARSPDGEIHRSEVPGKLRNARCYVHLKTKDCPGYALYSAMFSACPVIVTKTFIEATGFSDLYEHEESCLISEPTVEGIRECIDAVASPKLNRQIGEAGRQRAMKLVWSNRKKTDAESFREFMKSWQSR
jgi:glycosyltransferase involved in cell wall biosynthesis